MIKMQRGVTARAIIDDPRYLGERLAIALVITEYSHWMTGNIEKLGPTATAHEVGVPRSTVEKVRDAMLADGYLVVTGEDDSGYPTYRLSTPAEAV